MSIFTVPTLYAKQYINLVSADPKKYCYTTSSGKYEITLEQGGDNKTYYKLYSGSGELVKTMQGYWEIRDEGVYGSSYVLTIRWFLSVLVSLPSQENHFLHHAVKWYEREWQTTSRPGVPR